MATAELKIVIDAQATAAAALKQVEQQLGGIGGAAKSAGGMLGTAWDAGVKGLGSLQSAAGSAMKGLAMLGLAAEGLRSIGDMAKGAGNALGVGLGMEVEQVRAQMMAFLKTEDAVTAVMKELRSEADKTPFSFREMSDAAASLIPATKQAGVGLMDLMRQAEILAASNPLEGLKGASFALREAISGDFTSIIERFNLSRTTINQLKAEGLPAMEIVGRAMAELGLDAELVGNMAATTAGKFSTFQDAIDGVRLKVGQPILEALKVQLEAAARWLDANKKSVDAFAQSLGATLSGAIAGAVGLLQTIAPTLQTMALGVQTMALGWQMLPQPIQTATVALVAFGAAAALVMLNPVVASIALLTAGLALLVGKLRETNDEAMKLEREGLDATQKWATGMTQGAQQATTALDSLKKAGASQAEQVEALRARHEELHGVILREPDLWRTNKGAWDEATGSMRALEKEAQTYGVTLGMAADGATVVIGTVKELPGVLTGAGQSATKLDPIKAKLQEIASDAKKAFDELHKLMSAPTGAEIGVAASLANIKAAQEGLTLATRLSGDEQRYWVDKAQAMIGAANLQEGTLSKATGIIQAYQKGTLDGAAAVKQFEEVLKPSVATLEQVGKAESAVREAKEATAKADVATTRGWSDNLEEREGKLNEFVSLLKGIFPDITKDVETFGEEANKAIGEIGNEEAQGVVKEHIAAIADAMPPPVEAKATEAKDQANAQLNEIAGGDVAATVSGNASAVGAAVATGVGAGFNAAWPAVQGSITAQIQALANESAGAIQARSPSQLFAKIVGEPVATGIGEGFKTVWPEVVDQIKTGVVEMAATVGQTLSRLGTTDLVQFRQELTALDVQIAALKRQIADAPPKSQLLKDLKEQMQDLTSQRSELQATVKSLKEAANAADQFGASMEQSLARIDWEQAFGPAGADAIQALTRAFTEGAPEAGAALASAVTKLADDARKAGIPEWREIANTLWANFGEALASDDAGTRAAAIDAALGYMRDVKDQVKARLEGEDIAKQFASALRLDELTAQIGKDASSAMLAFEQSIKDGGPKVAQAGIALVKQLTDRMRDAGIADAAAVGQLMRDALAEGINTGDFSRFIEMTRGSATGLRDMAAAAEAAKKAQEELNKILSTGTREMAVLASESGALTALQNQIKAITVTADPQRIGMYVDRIAQLGNLAGIPPHVIASVQGYAQQLAGAALNADKLNSAATDEIGVLENRTAILQREIAQRQQSVMWTTLDWQANQEGIATAQREIQYNTARIASLKGQTSARLEDTEAFKKMMELLTPFIAERTAAAGAESSYVQAIQASTKAQTDSLPTTQELVKAVSGLNDILVRINPQPLTTGVGNLGNAANTAEGKVDGLEGTVGELDRTLKDAIRDMESEAKKATAVGKNLAEGVKLGIMQKAGEVADEAAKMVKDAIAAAQSAAKTGSPSQEMIDKVGIPLGQGMALGLDEMVPMVQASAVALTDAAIEAAAGSVQSMLLVGTMAGNAFAQGMAFVIDRTVTDVMDALSQLAAEAARIQAEAEVTDQGQTQLDALIAKAAALQRALFYAKNPGGVFVYGLQAGITIPSYNAPYLAEGGIVRSRPGGTMANVGEGGEDEIVAPLSRLPDLMRSISWDVPPPAPSTPGEWGPEVGDRRLEAGEWGGSVVVNVNYPIVLDSAGAKQLAATLQPEIERSMNQRLRSRQR